MSIAHAMVIALGFMPAAAAQQPGGGYAARFDCALRSTLESRPYVERYREVITIPSWSRTARAVSIHRQFETHAVEDRGTVIGASPEGAGGFHISLATVGPVELVRTGGRGAQVSYHGTYVVFDAGISRVDGLCSADIRVRPALPPAPGRSRR